MTDAHNELSYVEQLRQVSQPYVDWCHEFLRARTSGVLSQQEEDALKRQGYGAAQEFQNALDDGEKWAVEADQKHLEDMKRLAEEFEYNPSGLEMCLEKITETFSWLSEKTQEHLITPICNFFKAIGEAIKNAYTGTKDYVGGFFKKEGDQSEEDHKDDLKKEGGVGPFPTE